MSQDSHPRKSIPREEGKLGSQIVLSNSSRICGTTSKFGNERVHREELSKIVNLMSVVVARLNLRKGHKRKPCTMKDAPAEQHGAWRKLFTSSRMREKLRFVEARVMEAPTWKSPEEREFVVDSGASMHILSKKELSSGGMETLRRSRTPTVWGSANKRGSTSICLRS